MTFRPKERRKSATCTAPSTDSAHDLRASEETRRHLLANLVHELGRPLGAIRAAVDALRSGAAEDPALRDELLVGVEQHIVQMAPLLDDLSHLHGQILGPS